MLSDHSLSYLSVCNVGVLWPGWIKMKLGKQVGLGPGHIVLDGAQLPCPQKGTQPPIFYFQPMSIVAKRLPISATAEHLFIIVGDVK